MADKAKEAKVKQSAWGYTKSWGGNPIAPALLATLITAQHLRPPQLLPLLFPPVLLFSSYINVIGYKVDGAGVSAAWSGLYLLLASRRKQPLLKRWGTRGIVRGASMALSGANLVAGGLVYAMERRKEEPTEGTGAT